MTSQTLPVKYKNQNRKQSLIASPPVEPNRKPFLPVLGRLHPKEAGRGVSSSAPATLAQVQCECLRAGLIGQTPPEGKIPLWALDLSDLDLMGIQSKEVKTSAFQFRATVPTLTVRKGCPCRVKEGRHHPLAVTQTSLREPCGASTIHWASSPRQALLSSLLKCTPGREGKGSHNFLYLFGRSLESTHIPTGNYGAHQTNEATGSAGSFTPGSQLSDRLDQTPRQRLVPAQLQEVKALVSALSSG